MQKYFFIGPVLKQLSEGTVFAAVFAIAMRILAAVVALGGFIAWIQMWRVVSDLDGVALFGGILFQLIFLVTLYALIGILLIRAGDIARIPMPNSEFVVIPIISTFIRTIGELLACWLTALAIGGFIFMLFGGNAYQLNRMLPDFFEASSIPKTVSGSGFGDSPSFIAALLFVVVSLLYAFFTLIFFYLLAECTLVIVDIARNLRAVRDRLDGATPTAPASAA